MPPSRRSSCLARSNLKGFTLLELLTVIAIIGVLAAILFPVMGHARKAARATQDMGNMRILGLSMLQYASENHGIINTWGYETGQPVSLDNTFWGRAWPYLRNTQLKQLNSANMKEVADDYISASVSSDRPDLVGNADGINYTLAFNDNLRTTGAPIPGYSWLTYTNFQRLQIIPRPAMAPYVAIGFWGFWSLSPKPLAEATRTEGVYWPFGGNRTALVYLDGHVENFTGSLTNGELVQKTFR